MNQHSRLHHLSAGYSPATGSALDVISSVFSLLQCLRGTGNKPPAPDIQPQVVHQLVHQVDICQHQQDTGTLVPSGSRCWCPDSQCFQISSTIGMWKPAPMAASACTCDHRLLLRLEEIPSLEELGQPTNY